MINMWTILGGLALLTIILVGALWPLSRRRRRDRT